MILRFFLQTITTTVDMQAIAECKQLPDFSVLSKITQGKLHKKLGVYNKKQVYQWLDVDVVPQGCNFIKTRAPALVFPFEFCFFFSLQLY